jgi:hypothetical protein
VRATTAFNRIIDIEGVAVSGVIFTPEGVVVAIRRRKRLHQCPCGWTTRSHYDRSLRRWRHLDLGVTKCFLDFYNLISIVPTADLVDKLPTNDYKRR